MEHLEMGTSIPLNITVRGAINGNTRVGAIASTRPNCFPQGGLSRFKSGISSESMKTTEKPGQEMTSVSSLRSDSNVRLFVQKHEGGWIAI
jgi:hypothetical protein